MPSFLWIPVTPGTVDGGDDWGDENDGVRSQSRTIMGPMFPVQLERIRRLSSTTLEFRFAKTEATPLQYTPGQFFRFVFTDDEGEFERSYSLCNFDELYGQHLDLVVSEVFDGRATRHLFNATEGMTASVTGPFGRLVLPDPLPQRLVMLATSVGIAPYMPIFRQLEAPLAAGQIEVVLLFGVRDSAEFLYAEQLLNLLSQDSGFSLLVCYSRESLDGRQAKQYEREGYVTAQLDGLALDSRQDHLLLCGNPVMVEDSWTYLQEKGFKPAQVIREKYVFAKRDKPSADTKAMSDEHKRLIAEKLKKYQT